MRSRHAMALALILIAGSAGAQTPSKMSVPAAPVLRGAQNPAGGAVGRLAVGSAPASTGVRAGGLPPAPVPAAPAAPLMSLLPAREPPACRTTCARAYYLCLSAGDGPEDCGATFGQCVARCDRAIG